LTNRFIETLGFNEVVPIGDLTTQRGLQRTLFVFEALDLGASLFGREVEEDGQRPRQDKAGNEDNVAQMCQLQMVGLPLSVLLFHG
jgi:hypothetical protein